MRNIFGGSPERRQGAMDGLNLFFAALLGANLGTLDGLRLLEYVQLIIILLGTVMALRIVSTSGRLRDALVVLIPSALLLGIMALTAEGKGPTGLQTDDLHRLIATMVIWVGFVLVMEVARRKGEAGASRTGDGKDGA